MDDDADCVEHLWRLIEVVAGAEGAQTVSECSRCEAVRVEVDAGRRPPLGPAGR